MGVRTASASAILGALALTLVAPAAAQAAPAPISPRYASSAQAPGGSWAGLAPLDASSTGRTDRPLGSGTSLDLRVREPAGATGRVLDASLAGIVTLDVTQLTAGTTGTTGSTLTSWASAPTGEPTGWPGANDRLTSSFSIDQPLTTWAFRYAFDFSGLAGGVLPAGSRIVAADVDVCQGATAGGVDERFTATSSAVGPWLDYEYRIVRSGMQTPTPTVTYDPDANAYGVAPQCADRDMIEAFVTTQPMASLTIELANRQGAGLTRFGLLLPTAAPTPALTLATTTQSEDVDAAPGPRIPIGDDVEQAFTATNAGDVALADVTVTDDSLDAAVIDCGDGTNVIASLAVGAAETCTATDVAVAGEQQRTVTASGTPVDSLGDPIAGALAATAQDASWYLGVVDPAASLATVASGGEAAPGTDVTFTTTIENTGVTGVDGGTVEAIVPAGLEVTDAGDGTIVPPDGDVVRWSIPPLAMGETATATLTGTVLPADPGSVVELRTTGTAAAGGTAFALDPVEPCVDDVDAACAIVTVAAAPATPAPTSAPASTPPPSAAPSTGSLPATGADLAPAAWIVAMATLLVGLGIVLRRRLR